MTNLYILLFCAGYMVAAMMQTTTYLAELNGEAMTHMFCYRLFISHDHKTMVLCYDKL